MLHSDTEPEPETSSSSVSALFSHHENQSVYSITIDDESSDPGTTGSLRSHLISNHLDLKSPSHPPSSSSSPHRDPDQDPRGATLTLKSLNKPLPSSLHHRASNDPSTSSSISLHPLQSSNPTPSDDHDLNGSAQSFSSNGSSERHSTIKATISPNPSSSSQPQSPRDPPSTRFHPRSAHSQIDKTVLAVLASGAKGTVTRLEPSKKPSPVQAGLDWDEDLVLPDGDLQTVFRPNDLSKATDVRKKSSFASGISDELEDLNLAGPDHHPSLRSVSSSLSQATRASISKPLAKCSTVDEEDGDFALDFELPPSGKSIHLTDLKNHPRSSVSKPSSMISLLGSDDDLPKSSPSSRRGSILMSSLSAGSSDAASLPTANRAPIDDSTPRIRTRPSLTPSLMSDRSSSSFPEIEDDLNEGFFDDIEFPPEFGIPNNLVPLPASSVPTPTPSSSTHKVDQIPHSDPKGKHSSRMRPIDLQSYLNSKVQARALMVERSNSSSLVQQLRQSISTFVDRKDERAEDGLEIETGSIHVEKLRSRKSSSISSSSSFAHQSNRNSYFQQAQSHRMASGAGSSKSSQASKPKRVTVPFPSSNSTASTTLHVTRPIRPPSSRSNLIHHQTDQTLSPIASSSASITPVRTNASHASLIHRPNSASHLRLHALIPQRPISATGVVSAFKSNVYGSFAHPTDSDLSLRTRTKSLRMCSSNGELQGGPPPRSSLESPTTINTAGRVPSPLGITSQEVKPGTKTGASSSRESSRGVRLSATPTSTSRGPPLLSASNQRTLKHKKSAAALKSTGLGSSDSHTMTDSRSPALSPPGSSSISSIGRSLQRKQSMPSLNRDSHHSSSPTAGLPVRFADTRNQSSSTSAWKSILAPKSKSKQPTNEYSSPPTSSGTVSASSHPSYADPTRASMNRHVGGSSVNIGISDRITPSNSRRSSSENVRPHTSSPHPPLVVSHAGHVGNSRLMMPTIATRLKAKPSIIHEEQDGNNSKRWISNGIAAVVPQQLRRPKRPRAYGDGTELDGFDDLPTSKEKEKMFTRVVKSYHHHASRTTSSKPGASVLSPSSSQDPPYERRDELANSTITNPRSRSRLEARKADGARRRNLAINGHIKKVSTKKGLIRQMSGNALAKLSNNSEMSWNELEARWEGNEHILREFDNVLSTSSRPALISQLSIQSPMMRSPSGLKIDEAGVDGPMSSFKTNKAQNHVVGGMVFDAEAMSWRKLSGEDDEDELRLESDEELEMRWLADDESSSHHKGIGGRHRNDGWNSLSSSISLSTRADHPTINRSDQLHHDDTIDRSDLNDLRRPRRRSGSFWQACVEAEERHKKEIKSWIPIDRRRRHPSPSTLVDPSSRKVASTTKPTKSKLSLGSSSHPSSSTTTTSSSSSIHRPQKASPSYPSSSVVLGTHSHGRLTDADRCYLQEIRKLVLEDV